MASLKDISLQNRNTALTENQQLIDQGSTLQDQAGATSDIYSNQAQGYQSQADAAAAQLQQTPGYTAQEAAQIAPDYSQYATGSGDLQNRQLTSAEQGQIMGDPNAAMQYYDPSQTTADVQGSTQNQQQATDVLQQQMNAAAGNEQLGLNNATNAGAENANNALGTEGQSMITAYGNEAAGLNASVDPSQLGLSANYAANEEMTPQQQQDMVTAAGVTAGNQYRSQQSDIARQAAAQGNTSPMAIAAMNEQLNRDSAASAGDAMTQARIDASNAAASRLQTEEATRLGSAQDIAGMEQQNATTLGNTQMQAIDTYGAQNLSNAQAQEQAQANAAATGGQATANAAATGGQAAINTANTTGQETLAAEQQNQATGQGLATAADTAASNRADTLATNRQASTADIQNTQYNQGMATGQATATGAQTVANQRIAGNTAYRGYLTGQQAEDQSSALTASGQKISAYGDTTSAATGTLGAANAATSGATTANAQPSTAQQVVGAATGAAAAFLDDGDLDTSAGDMPTPPDLPAQIGTPAPPQTAAPADPSLSTWQKIQRYRQQRQLQQQQNPKSIGSNGQPQSQQQQNPNSWSQIGSNIGQIAGAVTGLADGGAPGVKPAIVGERGPEWITNLGKEGHSKGTLVTKPTHALMEKNDLVVPLNRTKNTKVPPSTLRMVPARYRPAGGNGANAEPMCDGGVRAEPMAAGGIVTKGAQPPAPMPTAARMPGSAAGALVRSRYRRPTGPAGPHNPLHINEPLHPMPAYR